jgi:hypothetical protein
MYILSVMKVLSLKLTQLVYTSSTFLGITPVRDQANLDSAKPLAAGDSLPCTYTIFLITVYMLIG